MNLQNIMGFLLSIIWTGNASKCARNFWKILIMGFQILHISQDSPLRAISLRASANPVEWLQEITANSRKNERKQCDTMQFTFPNYYKEFSCIAGACPDTCCAGWQIVIDDQTLKKYQHFKGPFRNRLHNDIDWNNMFSASIPDAVLFSTKRTCVISTQKQDRKCSAEPAEIILDILKNLKVCVRSVSYTHLTLPTNSRV